MIDQLAAQDAAAAVARGTSVAQVAESWKVSPGTLYRAFKRYDITLPNMRQNAETHLDLHAQSGVPPEVYAHRASISLATMRRYAWGLDRKLPVNTHAERVAYWQAKLDTFNPQHARAFCALHDLPLPMVAHWYHKLNNPPQLLLWGFNELLTVEGDQFRDFSRYADKDASLYALGQGKHAVPIGIRLANEVFSFTRQYQQH